MEEENTEDDVYNASFGSSGDETGIHQLRKRKEELERQMAEQHRQQQTIAAVLADDQEHRQIELEIRPLILVPDTNCFIDHHRSIQRLLGTQKYTIVVPLIGKIAEGRILVDIKICLPGCTLPAGGAPKKLLLQAHLFNRN